MDAYITAAFASLLIPAVYLVLAGRGRFGRAVMLWLLWPVVLYCGIFIWEVVGLGHEPVSPSDFMLGFSLLSAILILPWLLVSAVVLGLTFAVRTVIRRTPPPVAEVLRPEPPAPQPAFHRTVDPQRMAWEGYRKDHADGTIAVEFEPIEWYNQAWLSPPRVTDLTTGRIVLDLWNQDWDAQVTYPAPRQVILDCSRFSGAGVKALLDLATNKYRLLELRCVPGPFAWEPLDRIAQGFEDASIRSAEAVRIHYGKPPPIPAPTMRYSVAALVLTGLLVVIAEIAVYAMQTDGSSKVPVQLTPVPEGGFRPYESGSRR